jgi:PAP2 superfamily C-terminal
MKTKKKQIPPVPEISPWRDVDFEKSLGISLLLLAISLIINTFASSFASKNIGQPVADILLSNLPQLNLDGLIIILSLVLLGVMAAYGATHPKKIPFILKSAAVFILIRAIFINLTHIGPFSPNLAASLHSFFSFNLGNNGDYFFSGHTGLPFLAALMFWKNKRMRNIFLAGSIVLGACVLLGHFHYSIDVFGAFFITYAIHHINIRAFKKDWHVFKEK